MIFPKCSRLRFSLMLITVGGLLTGCSNSQPLQPSPTPAVRTTTLSITATRSPTATLTPLPTLAHSPEHHLGPDSAFLTIVLYGDFQSALTLDVARNLEIVRETYPSDVRLVWRNFPQPEDDKAVLAAQAAEAAADQGKFWEMHDQLLVHQTEWVPLTISQFHSKLAEYATLIGLDVTKFYAVIDNGTALDSLRQAVNRAQEQGFKAAPGLVFNGLAYSGRIDQYALDSYTRLRLLEKRWFPDQPTLQIDLNKHYTATLTTEKGIITIALNSKAAPVTVNNFVFLARAKWYDNITFHLVLPGVLAQTGDPSGSGLGTPGYTIIDEHDNGLKFDHAGLVAMASQRGTANSGGSQFFITMAPLQPEADYDGQFTIFGHVISGLDVLGKLTARNANDTQNFPNPAPGDKLLSVTIQEG